MSVIDTIGGFFGGRDPPKRNGGHRQNFARDFQASGYTTNEEDLLTEMQSIREELRELRMMMAQCAILAEACATPEFKARRRKYLEAWARLHDK